MSNETDKNSEYLVYGNHRIGFRRFLGILLALLLAFACIEYFSSEADYGIGVHFAIYLLLIFPLAVLPLSTICWVLMHKTKKFGLLSIILFGSVSGSILAVFFWQKDWLGNFSFPAAGALLGSLVWICSMLIEKLADRKN